MGRTPVKDFLLPAGLMMLCIVPTIVGGQRITRTLIEGKLALDFLPDVPDVLPLMLHSIGGISFLLLGALQMSAGLRHRYPSMHRYLGRAIVALGFLGAVSGIWATLMHPGISGPILFWGRMSAATFWIVALVLAVCAILRRDIGAHRRWMIRAYAIALPAGTLAFILLPFILIDGEDQNELLVEIIQVSAWIVHLAGAEWVIRRKRRKRPLRN